MVTLILTAAGLAAVALLVYFAYRRDWQWTGLPAAPAEITGGEPRPAKTLWDGLALLGIPVVLAALAFLLNDAQTSREQAREDARTKGAEMQVIAVEPLVYREDWIKRTLKAAQEDKRRYEAEKDKRRSKYTNDQLRDRGTVIYVRVNTQGLKGSDAVLRWSMYTAHSRRRVAQDTLHDVEDHDLALEAPTDGFVVQVWVPPLHKTARLFVRVDLKREGTVLAVADSPAFVESHR